MSMKKVVILAVAALTLVACAKTYELQETAQPKIGFDTWANNLTKARTQGTSTFVDGDDFAVYGYKDKSDDSAPNTVFNGVTVRTSDGTAWSYDTPRFWDSNYDKYIFYAISPAAAVTGGTVNAQTGVISTAAITFAGNDNDILVADKKQVDKGSAPYFNNYATVPLVFNHVASLVDIKVKKTTALANVSVTVSAFELENIYKKGALSVNTYDTNKPVATWSDAETGTYGPTVDITSPIEIVKDTNFDPATPGAPADATSIINNLVVKPQTFIASNGTNPQQISITYKIGAEDSVTKVLYLADFDTVDDADQSDDKIAKWEPGKHYTFYITLDAHAINFSATITDWTAVSGYNYLVY